MSQCSYLCAKIQNKAEPIRDNWRIPAELFSRYEIFQVKSQSLDTCSNFARNVAPQNTEIEWWTQSAVSDPRGLNLGLQGSGAKTAGLQGYRPYKTALWALRKTFLGFQALRQNNTRAPRNVESVSWPFDFYCERGISWLTVTIASQNNDVINWRSIYLGYFIFTLFIKYSLL